jgi:oligosaccharide repeat unit polymerase
MHIIYFLLSATLIATYLGVSVRILRFSSGLNLLTGWMAGVGYFVVLPLTVLTLAGRYRLADKYDVGQNWGEVDLTSSDYLLAYLTVWAAAMLMCATIWVTARPNSRKAQVVDLRTVLERALTLMMAVLSMEWMLLIRLVGGLNEFISSHWYQRSENLVAEFGDRYVFVSHWMQASDIIFVSAAALYASLSLRFGRPRKKVICLTVVFLVLQMVMTGNRIYIAIYLLAFFVSCLLFKKNKALLWMLASAPALLLIFSAWAMVRHDLTAIPDSVAAFSDAQEGSSATASLLDASEGMDVVLLLHIVLDYGVSEDFLYGSSYLKTITSWIPRSLYPTKTKNFSVLLARKYLPNQETSINATVLGELYANFGAFTLLFFPLLTFGVLNMNNWVERHSASHPTYPALFFVLAIWMVRITFTDAAVLCVMCVLQMFVLRLDKIVSDATSTPAAVWAEEAAG